MPVRVVIFEDRKTVRDAITLLVKGTAGLELAGAFPDCNNVVSNIISTTPDVVLMDIEMPGMNGIAAVKLIKQHFPKITVVMQTVFEDDEKIFAAICAGASGYILKKIPPAALIEAIYEVYNGGAPLTGSIASKVLQMFQKNVVSSNDEIASLSTREKEILQCLVNGRSYKMIAEYCNISYDTVRFHIKNIYEKLHVNSMTGAVAKAINEHIV